MVAKANLFWLRVKTKNGIQIVLTDLPDKKELSSPRVIVLRLLTTLLDDISVISWRKQTIKSVNFHVCLIFVFSVIYFFCLGFACLVEVYTLCLVLSWWSVYLTHRYLIQNSIYVIRPIYYSLRKKWTTLTINFVNITIYHMPTSFVRLIRAMI